MTTPEDQIRAHIEALTEELRVIPRHKFNERRIADRERALAMYRADLERRERTQELFIARRAELLARCGQFKNVVMH